MDTLIVGAGSQAATVVSILRHDHNLHPVGCVSPTGSEKEVNGCPVLGDMSLLPHAFRRGIRCAIVAIGDNYIRQQRFYELEQMGFHLVNALHPSVVVDPTATLGRGVIIDAGTIISGRCQIGNGCILAAGCTLAFGVLLGDHVRLEPGVRVGASVQIHRHSLLRCGAVVANRVVVGKNNETEVGAIITCSIPDRELPEDRLL